MPTITTYTTARATLAALCDEVASTREPVIIRRRNAEDVALVSASELESLLETAHLLRSPKNAERLLSAISRAQRNALQPSSVGELREQLGVGEEAAASTSFRLAITIDDGDGRARVVGRFGWTDADARAQVPATVLTPDEVVS